MFSGNEFDGDGGSLIKIEYKKEPCNPHWVLKSSNNSRNVTEGGVYYEQEVIATSEASASAQAGASGDIKVLTPETNVEVAGSSSLQTRYLVKYTTPTYSYIEYYNVEKEIMDVYEVGYLIGTSTKSGYRSFYGTVETGATRDVRIRTERVN